MLLTRSAEPSNSVSRSPVQPSTLTTINAELANYATVFTSNYDLLNYWAILHTPGIDDLFRSADASFDLRNTRTEATRILYLHGGLHLVRNLDGTARKLPSTDSTLLSSFAINNTIKTLDDVPLFVSEGKVEEKLKTIRSSDYLSFCYEQLLTHQGALCLFGHDLGAQDKHLVDAIRQARPSTLAISVSGRSDGFIRQQKRRYSELFDGSGVVLKFFAARTHPLGNPALSVPVEH